MFLNRDSVFQGLGYFDVKAALSSNNGMFFPTFNSGTRGLLYSRPEYIVDLNTSWVVCVARSRRSDTVVVVATNKGRPAFRPRKRSRNHFR